MAQKKDTLMIEAIGLTKYFDSFKAIEDITFNVEKGEIVGFIGPNGSGKTTTMRILTCFMPPSKGTARIAGYDILENSLEVRRHIGYMPEGAPLYTNLPVETYLEFVAEMKGMEHSEIKRRIGEVMEICGIAHVAKRFIENLSKGYRQRVCLAQTILNDPEVLILDEPTIGLDPKQVVEVRNLIKELSGQRTVLLSSHILSEISMICDRVIIINRGKVVAEDTIDNLAKKAQEERQLILKVKAPEEKIDLMLKDLGAKILSKELDKDEGNDVLRYRIETKEDLRDVISEKVIENNWKLLEIGLKKMSLEEIYLKLIGEEKR